MDKCFTIAGAEMQVMRECVWLNESRHLECSEIRACVSVSRGLIGPDYTDSSAIRVRAFGETKPNMQRNINAPKEQQTNRTLSGPLTIIYDRYCHPRDTERERESERIEGRATQLETSDVYITLPQCLRSLLGFPRYTPAKIQSLNVLQSAG